MSSICLIAYLCLVINVSSAFLFKCSVLPIHQHPSTIKMTMQPSSRDRFVAESLVAALSIASYQPGASFAEEITTKTGLKIQKLVNGTGQKCDIGDLAAIRFKGRYKDFEFDNLFNSDEPLYFRAGGGNLVKGIDEAIVMMRVGDRWELTIPGPLGFGDKGRPPSPGKPRIPPNATLQYEVELVSLPGKEDELFNVLE